MITECEYIKLKHESSIFRHHHGMICLTTLTVSLNPSICVISEVPETVSRQSATKASELLDSATTYIKLITIQMDANTYVLTKKMLVLRFIFIHTSNMRLRKYFPPRESRPSPPKAFKLSATSFGKMLSCIRFYIQRSARSGHCFLPFFATKIFHLTLPLKLLCKLI